MGAELADVAREARGFVEAAPPGAALEPLTAALVAYGVAACATALDPDGLAEHGTAALSAGADEALLIEVLVLVSAVGLHALHEGVLALGPARGADPASVAALRQRHEGSSSYWRRLEAELPGFADGLAGHAPWAYEAFLAFAGSAVLHGRLDRLTRELVWVAIDATPTHRYLPGLRVHLANAVLLGATREQLDQVLRIAAGGPTHRGVGRHAAPA